MTLKTAYEELGGDYADIIYRVGEDMLLRLIGIFVRDSNYTDICTALECQDFEKAFRAAHTLKGVALNMSLPNLAKKADLLTETLRSRQHNDEIQPAFLQLSQEYHDTYSVFSELLAASAAGGEKA